MDFVRRTWKSIVASIVALLLGVAIGYASGDAAPEANVAELEQEVSTAGERINELQTELAEVQAQARATEGAAAPCRELIGLARDMNGVSEEFAALARRSMDNASEAFEAIASRDLNSINELTEAQRSINREFAQLTDRAQAQAEPFNRLVNACEEGG